MTPLRPAAFLDRDNTVLRDPGFARDPDLVVLMPGAGPAIRRLNAAGIPVVIVTNQSGIARGIVTPAEYAAVTDRMHALLALDDARLTAVYHCPHLPELSGECECRKPGTLLYRQAAEEHRLDLRRSWYIGDRLTDVMAATPLGGHGLLLASGTIADDDARGRGHVVVADLTEAAEWVVSDAHRAVSAV